MADTLNLGNAGTLSPEAYAQQQQINRQQQLANMLLQNSQQQPQGQMISGHYVAPSFTQNLVPLANALAGQYLGNKADTQAAALAQQLRQQGNEDLTNVMTQLQGRPASSQELPGPAYNNVAPSIQYPAVQANPQAALQTALQSESPQVKAIVPALIQNTLPKTPDKVLEYKQAVQDGFKGTYNDWATQITPYQKEELRLRNIEVSNAAKNAAINPQENQLRTSFLNQAQPHIQISQAYRKIVSAPETAAGDMSRIFGYMKILDPGSTVREGEYASAENARGVPASVMAQYNRVLNGQRLTPQQRNEFTQSAGDLVNSQKQQFADVAKYYGDISGRYGVNPENIIYDPYQGLELKTTPPKAPKAPTNANEQLSIPSAGGWSVKTVK
jgi:hypothetical protein